MNLRSRILRFFESLGLRKRRYRIRHVADPADAPRPFEVYAIGNPHSWQVAFLCPCGCRDLIQLSLLKEDSPRWDLFVDRNDEATLAPSIWRTRGCESHFIVRRGQVIWCDKERR